MCRWRRREASRGSPAPPFATDAFNPRQPRDRRGRWASTGSADAPGWPSQKQLGDYARAVFDGTVQNRRLYFGSVTNAAQIQSHTGLDLSGWRRRLTPDEVRKNLSRHGSDRNPLRTLDFGKIREILEAPDRVKIGGKTKGRSLQALISEKRIDGVDYRIVEELQPKRKNLNLHSFSKD